MALAQVLDFRIGPSLKDVQNETLSELGPVTFV